MKSSNAISIGSSFPPCAAFSTIINSLGVVPGTDSIIFLLIQTGVRKSFSPTIRKRGFPNSGAICTGISSVGKSSGTSNSLRVLFLYCMTKGMKSSKSVGRERPMKAFTRLSVCAVIMDR